MGVELDKMVGTAVGGLGTTLEGVHRHLWRGRDGKMGTTGLLSLRAQWWLE